VRQQLEGRRFDVELVTVETTGDAIQDELIHELGKTGAFVRNLDQEVLDGSVDAAVHSLKDVPTDQPEDLVVAGVPQREAAGDVLVTPDGATLDELPADATVGTASLRRRAQLLAERPDLAVEPLRGNVDTRIEKLLAPSLQQAHQDRLDAEEEREERGDEDDYVFPYDRPVEVWFDDLSEIERCALEREVDTVFDGIVLAKAGLERAGLLHHVDWVPLDTETFVPAPGQGALAVSAQDSETARKLQDVLDHPRSRVETTVERTVLDELGGGCIAPIGVFAVLQGRVVRTTVRVLAQDGSEEVTASRDLPVERHISAAREFAQDLGDRGARDLIEQAMGEAPTPTAGGAAPEDAEESTEGN
jgi:hydroxymethylbilane synthase